MSKQNGRVSTRYEIGHHLEGLIDTEPTLAEAKVRAIRWMEHSSTDYPDKDTVTIYDSMARLGQTTQWKFVCGNWKGTGLRIV